jgi:glycerol-3-phosphate O-acyltransferase
VVMSTHVVAAASFARLQKSVGSADLFAILKHKDDVLVSREDLALEVDALIVKLRAAESKGDIVLAKSIAGKSGGEVVAQALRAFAGYHANPVIEPRGEDLVLSDTRLLFYYQNRLAAHGFAADHIAPKQRK